MIGKHVINNVEEFKIYSKYLFSIENEQTLNRYNLDNLKREILLKDDCIYCFCIFKGFIYYQLNNGSDIYLLNENLSFKGKYYLDCSMKSDDKIILLKKNIKDNKHEIISIENNIEIPLEVEFYPNRIINNNLYTFIALNTLFVYSLKNSLIWQHAFKDLLQAEEVLLRHYYVYKEKLILDLRTNGLPQNKYITVVLDVNTGNELYRTEETLGKKLINGLGYTLYNQILWISNPETYEVKRIDLSETLSPLNKIVNDKIGDVDLGNTEVKFRFSPTYFTVEYPYLYFSEERGLQVGVLNIETNELIFHTEIQENGLVKDLKASNGKLFVHTTENNLYVFG